MVVHASLALSPPPLSYQLVVLLGEQQDASYVGVVVVEGVQLRRGHVEGSRCWEAVVQLLVEGQQVHVVHRHVVRVIGTLHKAHVDQGGPVEPGGKGKGREGEREGRER